MSAAAYVLLDANDAPLYIGSSGNVAARVREHRRREFWPQVVDVEVHTTETLAEARSLERSLIRERNPIHNVVRMVGEATGPRPRKTPPKAFLASARKSLCITRHETARRASLLLSDYDAIEIGSRVGCPAELAAIEHALGFPAGSLRYGNEVA